MLDIHDGLHSNIQLCVDHCNSPFVRGFPVTTRDIPLHRTPKSVLMWDIKGKVRTSREFHKQFFNFF